jgi:hypothetical protein
MDDESWDCIPAYYYYDAFEQHAEGGADTLNESEVRLL